MKLRNLLALSLLAAGCAQPVTPELDRGLTDPHEEPAWKRGCATRDLSAAEMAAVETQLAFALAHS